MRSELARFRTGLFAALIVINFTSSQSGFLGKRNAQPEAAIAQAKSEVKAENTKVSTNTPEAKTNFFGAKFHKKVRDDSKSQVDTEAWFDVDLGAEDAKVVNTGKGTSTKVETMADKVERAETTGETQGMAKVATKVDSESKQNSDAKDATTSKSDTASSGQVEEDSTKGDEGKSVDTIVEEVKSVESAVKEVESVKTVESVTDSSADSVNVGAEIESVAAESNTLVLPTESVAAAESVAATDRVKDSAESVAAADAADDSVKDSEVDSSEVVGKEEAMVKARSQKSLSSDFFKIEDGKVVLEASNTLAAPDVNTHAGAEAEETEAEDDANLHEDDTMMAVAGLEDFAHEHAEDQYDEGAHDEGHEDIDDPDAHDHMDEDSDSEVFSEGDMEDDYSDDHSDSYDDDHDEDSGL